MPSWDLFKAQEELSRRGATLIAQNLADTLFVILYPDGRRQIVVRLKEGSQAFPLEWFKGFRVFFHLQRTPNTEITYSVSIVEYTKVMGIQRVYLTLTPTSDKDQILSDNEIVGGASPTNISRIELVTDEKYLIYLYHKEASLFVLADDPRTVS